MPDSLDLPAGLKTDIYEHVCARVDEDDRKIVKEFTPDEMYFYQRTNNRGMFSHDSKYLRMALGHDTGRKDFGPTVHEFSRTIIMREDAVLEGVCCLQREKRLELLGIVERDFIEQTKTETLPILQDLEWKRFQALKDILLRGEVCLTEQSLQAQDRETIFFNANSMETFGELFEHHAPQIEQHDPQTEQEKERLKAFDEHMAAWNAQHAAREARRREAERIETLLLERWIERASAEESDLFHSDRHEYRTSTWLEPSIKRILPLRVSVNLCISTLLQPSWQGEKLYGYDTHQTFSKTNPNGHAFVEALVRTLHPDDQRLLIDECARSYEVYTCESVADPVALFEYPRIRALLSPLFNFVKRAHVRAGRETVAQLRSTP